MASQVRTSPHVMDFYEELGVRPDADEKEIRAAHRRLVRLFHPDQHADDELKRVAERQLIRVNTMVEILLDPLKRKEYDSVKVWNQVVPYEEDISHVPRGKFRLAWGIASAVALVIAVTVVWSFINRTDPGRNSEEAIASVGNPRSVEAEKPQRSPATDRFAREAESQLKPVEERAQPKERSANRTEEPSASRQRSTPAPVISAAIDSSAVQSGAPAIPPPVSPKGSEPASSSATEHRSEATAPATPTDVLAGTWLYVPTPLTEDEKRLYPPEFIQLRIRNADGTLQGDYRSRYQVSDRPISPTVNFVFSGKIKDPQKNTFRWRGGLGTTGIVHLQLLSPHSLQVDWQLADPKEDGGLISGTAVLVKKM